MIPVKLSSRLRMSAEMIEPCHCVADIGCDHAHTDIWLIVNGIAEHCIGMDVRKGPLEKALANLKMFGCEEQVELRLSDGFDALRPFEAECAVAAGMGGIVMRTILERGLGEGGHLKDACRNDFRLQSQAYPRTKVSDCRFANPRKNALRKSYPRFWA